MQKVEDHTRAHKYDYKELGIALLCVVVLGLAAAIALIVIKQENNASTLHDVKQSNQILIDCTTPKHKCYEDGKSGTADIIKQLEQFDQKSRIIVAHCVAIGNYTVHAISTCVNNEEK